MAKTVLFLLFCTAALFSAETVEKEAPKTEGKVVVSGSYFYSKPIALLLDGSDKKTEVVMRAEIVVRRTQSGYVGYMLRGYYDLENQRMVPSVSKTVEGQNISAVKKLAFEKIQKVNENTFVCKTKKGLEYTFIDGGKGYINDKVVVKVHRIQKNLPLYGGDILITP